ncbi:hypothetical protein ABB37_09155 [Leptomonas pyrrhocoris]|uniref:Uncharacterized protein n=1 Tax=Leptomonas pyrrhocoris TaxID=157538 RepID=A0A0M9FRF8_LEPPY|nr:hypothetical protein ABB37_09155 [Leptomonas pyrrhocoris]XP_015652925.1 hypothetical protein ABB37_09155 [Leptomonas pyrrhocoris]XP_015652926.1 hypothetical protein ABB37_09155 [Leptomonas pyrrhocoris]KPA74485.1 hypothetical protein ABB37_09155 [Leptomonas pyrrhocoris]KPA74486.1 hypothetical protein ABB37_09155 [Leptomonas pyrrhocoris]KPA74487.1 hypothetical protein ABB37_09155 [Leptomonas pyrrhocoris]|eukprot:XP_015652924.1 hypothetical protein ABB37_09155 [Leptomonas pyrrhocoris]
MNVFLVCGECGSSVALQGNSAARQRSASSAVQEAVQFPPLHVVSESAAQTPTTPVSEHRTRTRNTSQDGEHSLLLQSLLPPPPSSILVSSETHPAAATAHSKAHRTRKTSNLSFSNNVNSPHIRGTRLDRVRLTSLNVADESALAGSNSYLLSNRSLPPQPNQRTPNSHSKPAGRRLGSSPHSYDPMAGAAVAGDAMATSTIALRDTMRRSGVRFLPSQSDDDGDGVGMVKDAAVSGDGANGGYPRHSVDGERMRTPRSGTPHCRQDDPGRVGGDRNSDLSNRSFSLRSDSPPPPSRPPNPFVRHSGEELHESLFHPLSLNSSFDPTRTQRRGNGSDGVFLLSNPDTHSTSASPTASPASILLKSSTIRHSVTNGVTGGNSGHPCWDTPRGPRETQKSTSERRHSALPLPCFVKQDISPQLFCQQESDSGEDDLTVENVKAVIERMQKKDNSPTAFTKSPKREKR